jgi:hypothetical protein
MGMPQDYYLEYVRPIGWNKGMGTPALVIRTTATFGGTPAYLGKLDIPSVLGLQAEFIEPLGNVKFQVERFDAIGRILKVTAKKQ